MSTLYLIRHGQAGPRDNYDQLSELGRRQAKLLGENLAAKKIEWAKFYSGLLNRQRQTAGIVSEQLIRSNLTAPLLITDDRWNEFSLADVYRKLAPRMVGESKEFAQDYQEMQEALIADPHTTRGPAGRCDRAVVEAWMGNRYPTDDLISWDDFCAAVRGSFDDLVKTDGDEHLAIFTSTTPIAIWVGMALSLSNDRILRLMAVLINSSLTTIKIREGEAFLIDFNTTPHLTDPLLQTYR